MQRDPFPRRTATPGGLLPWFAELGKAAGGLLGSYTGAVDPRMREQVMLAVTEVNGCRYCAWIHGSWRDFLGEGRPDPSDAVLAYARACAEAGQPLDPGSLADVMPPEAVAAVRATVAQIEVSNLVGNTVDGLIARLTRKRPADPLAAAGELAVVGAALPIAVPLLAVGAGLRAVARAAPPMPDIDLPPAGEANLLVHLLAEVAPAMLSNALVRLVVLGLPVPIAFALQAGRTRATVRVGRRRLAIENGVAPDALVVVEGDVEPLLRLAGGRLFDASSVRLRPRRPG